MNNINIEKLKEIILENLKNKSIDLKRVFHGRGNFYDDFSYLVVDSINDILMATFFEVVDENAQEKIIKMLDEVYISKGFKTLVIQRRYDKKNLYEIRGQIPQNPIAYENGLKYSINFSNQNIGIFPDMKNGRSFIKEISKDKKVFFFLIAFFLYIDGVGTIIDNCINIGTDLNLSTVGQVICLLATQVVAFGGSLVFAKLSKKYDTVQLILVCIAGYFIVCLYALTLKNLIGFSFLAFGVGCFQGSIQSLSRSYFSKIIPPDNSGEYFGLYDIFSKGASFLGSAVIAGVKLAGGTINIAVASQAIFFFLGFIFLKIADGKERRIVESK